MNSELHQNPALGHHQKGSAAMKKPEGHIREMRIEIHRGPQHDVTGHTVHHDMLPTKASKSGAFMEDTHHSYPFGADGHSTTHGHILDHIAEHLGLAEAGTEKMAEEEKAEGE